jgi:hypothetical protein
MRLRGMRSLDSNGNTKLSRIQLGTGASLQDPVIVSQGGTGLTSCAQGDLLYGIDSSAKTYPTPSVSTPAGMVLLSNQAANLNLTGQYSNGQYNNNTRGWVGYNGVTQLTEAQAVSAAFPSGTPVAYFATSDVATSLEALVVGIPVVATLPKDASGVKLLMNTGTSYRPAWSDPKTSFPLLQDFVTRKSAITQLMMNVTNFSPVIFWNTPTLFGTQTAVTDSVGSWCRFSTSAISGSSAGANGSNNWCWLDNNPTLRCLLRMSPAITGLRIWVTLSNVGGTIGDSNDQHALKGVGVRYSDSAGDPGWVTWSANGTTQTIGGAAIASITGSGVYPIVIEVTGGGANFKVSVGDASSTVAVPAAALGTVMRFNVQVTATVAFARYIEVLSGIYGEWD